VRLTGEIRDPVDNYLGDSHLIDVSRVLVYLYSEGELADSAETSYGEYVFECEDGGIYTVKTSVVPDVIESAGPVSCMARSCETPDTLVLAKYGDISLYPNPFMAASSVKFDLLETGATELTVRTVTGETVRTLLDAVSQAGRHTIQWDGLDDQGIEVAPGPYWIVLRVNDEYRYTLALLSDSS
jgi:hypothetical protein